MTLIKNESDTTFRYLIYSSKEYITWGPRQERDVEPAVASIITAGHPGRMVFVHPAPPAPEEVNAPDGEEATATPDGSGEDSGGGDANETNVESGTGDEATGSEEETATQHPATRRRPTRPDDR